MTANNQSDNENAASFISLGKLVAIIIFGAAIYIILGFIDNWGIVLSALSTIEWWWVIPTMMGLSFINYIFRYFKWQYYLKRIDVHFSHIDSFSIFLAGFTLTVSPGKIGEAIKGYFCRDIDGTPVAKTVPVVVSERVTDLLAMVIIAAVSFMFLVAGGDQILLVVLVGGAVILAALVLSNKAFYNKILKRITKFGPLKRFEESCDDIEDTMVKTLSPEPMLIGTAISTPGWFMECLELWLLLSLMSGAGLPSLSSASLLLLAQAAFVHASASSVGALVIIAPAGLGAYEFYFRAVMEALGFTIIATASLYLIRFVTLWFSVIVGFIALGIVTHRNRKRRCENDRIDSSQVSST